jgi:hypothetical protein
MGGPTSDQARIIERWWLSPSDGNLLMAQLLQVRYALFDVPSITSGVFLGLHVV